MSEKTPSRVPVKRARRPHLRWLERTLLAAGLICLATVAALAAESRFYQLLGRWQLWTADPAAVGWLGAGAGNPGTQAGTRSIRPAADRLPAPGSPDGGSPDGPAPGTPLGTIEIPGTGVDAVILEGVEAGVLRRGIGHFPRTPMPGAGGNFALAGHRDTFFRGLRDLRVGQRVVIDTADGRRLAYRVESTEVVEPTRVDVLDDPGHESLTLITCYPFRYVGPAPQRFVVRARPETPLDGAASAG